MVQRRCPQCSAAVAAADVRCNDCGYQLGWRGAPDDETGPLAIDTSGRRGTAPEDEETVERPSVLAGARGGAPEDEETVERPFDLAGARGGAPEDDETVERRFDVAGARGGGPEDDATVPVGPITPAAATQQETTHDVAPPVFCPTCGAANPAGRTLCERCGMGLATEVGAVRDGPRWWRGRFVRFLLLAMVVVGGAVVGLAVFGDAFDNRTSSQPDPPAADGPPVASPSAEPSAAPSEPSVVLEPGTNGPEVARWQQLLLSAGLDVSVDSQFGPATEQATARFQRSIGEEPTGRVTTRTMAVAQNGSSLRRVRVFLVRDGELDGVRRRVDRTQLARGALEMLVAGPLRSERDGGLSTAVPAGTVVRSVRVDRGTADVALTGFAADPEEQSLRQRVEQVVATLTRFESVDTVRFQLPPDDAMVFADAGVVLTEAPGG